MLWTVAAPPPRLRALGGDSRERGKSRAGQAGAPGRGNHPLPGGGLGGGRLGALSSSPHLPGLDPRFAEARFNLALLHAAQGSHAEAIALLREGLRRQPDNRPTRQLLAWELATAPDPRLRNGAEALRLAQGAMQEAGPQALHVLAAARAETGRFEEALRTAREAAARAGSAGLKEDAGRIREAIARYERGEPMRSPGK